MSSTDVSVAGREMGLEGLRAIRLIPIYGTSKGSLTNDKFRAAGRAYVHLRVWLDSIYSAKEACCAIYVT